MPLRAGAAENEKKGGGPRGQWRATAALLCLRNGSGEKMVKTEVGGGGQVWRRPGVDTLQTDKQAMQAWSRLVRRFSTCTRALQHQQQQLGVEKLDVENIAKHFDVSYARSSGAGGQHVNTTDTKAVVRMPAARWYAARGRWIPGPVFDTLMANTRDPKTPMQKRFPFFSPSGDVVISSSTTRYRDKNLAECFRKFVDAVAACGHPRPEASAATRESWEQRRRHDNEARIRDKKRKGDKKSSRRKPSMGDY